MQVAFKTGDYKQQAIFIGGLTDGFLATEYVTMFDFLKLLSYKMINITNLYFLAHKLFYTNV